RSRSQRRATRRIWTSASRASSAPRMARKRDRLASAVNHSYADVSTLKAAQPSSSAEPKPQLPYTKVIGAFNASPPLASPPREAGHGLATPAQTAAARRVRARSPRPAQVASDLPVPAPSGASQGTLPPPADACARRVVRMAPQ